MGHDDVETERGSIQLMAEREGPMDRDLKSIAERCSAQPHGQPATFTKQLADGYLRLLAENERLREGDRGMVRSRPGRSPTL